MPVKKFLKAAKDIEASSKEAPKAPASHDESNWLVSYADMMTLLCGFFIMLFSMAKMDEPQYEKVKEAMVNQFGGDYKSPTKELAKFITQILQQAGIEQQVSVKIEGTGVSLIFESTLFFDTLSAEVTPDGRTLLDKLLTMLIGREKAEAKEYQIVVEGHTDSRPILGGNFPSNWELSGARASRVVRYFLEKGFSSDHLTAIGYGDTRPLVPSRKPDGAYDEQALAKNRRVVLRILNPKADAIPFPTKEGTTEPPATPATPATPANTAH
ncbi:flagellar motor protein MotB [Bdellovibrionota bacterium FG-1]